MRRLHLFELEDQAWFPATIRDLATDYLHFMQNAGAMHRGMLPFIEEALKGGGTTHIVDLCSGGTGPVPAIVQDLREQGIPVTATLTYLYPNARALEQAAAACGGAIDFVARAVDARAVPQNLLGLRTLFNGFHHFRPADARAILRDAAAARQPIAIFEVSRRSTAMILPVLLVPLFVLLATPFMKPFKWKRLFWTYVLPLVPLTCLWDGMVSQLRAYTVPELREMAAGAGVMTWRADDPHLFRSGARVTYLLGWPDLNEREGVRAEGPALSERDDAPVEGPPLSERNDAPVEGPQ
jgi:hypothetical protein